MKIVLVVALLLSAPAFSQQRFELNGNVVNVHEKLLRVMISYRGARGFVTDTVDIKNGRYRFQGMLTHPVLAYGWAEPAVKPAGADHPGYYAAHSMTLFLSPGIMQVEHGPVFSRKTVRGSLAQKDLEALETLARPLNDSMDGVISRMLEARARQDTASENKWKEVSKELMLQRAALHAGWARTHVNSPIILYVFSNFINTPYEGGIDTLFPRISAGLQNSAEGNELARHLVTMPGKPAPAFLQPDTAGRPVRLSDFRGRYVLVDFWASWCKPCREENPGVMKLFSKYKDRGFTVVSISLDEEKERWLSAIRSDGLQPWVHVSDLKGWNNSAARTYVVTAVPENFLVGPDGKILGGSLHGEGLKKKLQEIFSFE